MQYANLNKIVPNVYYYSNVLNSHNKSEISNDELYSDFNKDKIENFILKLKFNESIMNKKIEMYIARYNALIINDNGNISLKY